ncbi:hypothetical protein [Azospirillum lipoferum]|uniref:Uncharacterized protein n=1 Tax=Azospirillum lipoferum (strain 4B) TaxID=862719 RepID=G7Z631_AZOL4|nr:hypothetical protein [Azospirillum lipoferum]CBS87922.1 Protein of unknown function [Azospirillum lipoferum 4B]
MTTLYCACCGRPFIRTSARGPAPRYCSQDCRLQMAVRRRAWAPRMETDRTDNGRMETSRTDAAAWRHRAFGS